jgi:ElaB/YqjD/DUF883 family membrane-anchored ribosome-binding protein
MATSNTPPFEDMSQRGQRVEDKLQRAEEKIDERRGAAAEGLDSAADTLHQKADRLPGGDKVSSAAHTTADALASTADYIREHDLRGMVTDVQSLVKRNPGPALLAAAAVGFLVARTFSRD